MKHRLPGTIPPGFCSPGKSLVGEIEKLREAVLMLCELQKQLAAKVDAALNEESPITSVEDQRQSSLS